DRNRLRDLMNKLRPADEKGGYIVRTMAEEASEEDIANDIEFLRKSWKAIVEASRTQPAPTLLHQDLDLGLRVLRDFVNEDTASIQ
ncbi:ribonuclease E/G, partial [Acinetobacter baumannii]